MPKPVWIHKWREDNLHKAVFAFVLDGNVRQRDGSREAASANLIRQMDFINSLHQCDQQRYLALRYIFRPGDGGFLATRAQAVILGGCTVSRNSGRAAAGFSAELAALLGGAMPECNWRQVDSREEFTRLWQPFGVQSLHLAELRRREEEFHLETLRPRPALGRRRQADPAPDWNAANLLYLVNGFSPRSGFLDKLFHTLQLASRPLIWQISLAPTCLEEREEKALRETIGKCEAYLAQSDRPEQRQRAAQVARRLSEQLVRLSDAPYLLNISLASPRPLPRTLVERIGVEITAPVSPGDNGISGGYDVTQPRDEAQQRAALINLQGMDFQPWASADTPANLTRLHRLVDATEAATALRLPFSPPSGLPGIISQGARILPLPGSLAELAADAEPGLQLGENRYMGQTSPVFMDEKDRLQHLYVMGQTGTGKTTFLKRMILSDIQAGRGVAVIDPHGDLFNELLTGIPAARAEDVVVLDPTDTEHPIGINLLAAETADQRHFVVREMSAIMKRLMTDQYGAGAKEWTGPVFFQHMQMNMLLTMSDPEDPGTLLEFYEIFQHKDYWKRWLPLKWSDAMLRNWVDATLPATDYNERSEGTSLGEYVSSKFTDFIFDPRLQLIFGQKTCLDFNAIMNEGKILLVNLAKGELTEANASFLGMILMSKIQAAAMERAGLPVEDRKPFYLYVDEFQNLATENFSLMLSEARKFGIGLVLANQFISQIDDRRIIQSIFGNVGSLVCFRSSWEDAEILRSRFQPHFDAHDLSDQPNWSACVKTLCRGQPVPPFTLNTILSRPPADAATPEAVRRHSQRTWGTSAATVERIIERSLGEKQENTEDLDVEELRRKVEAAIEKDGVV